MGNAKPDFLCSLVSGPHVERAIEVRRQVYVEEFGFDLGGDARDEIDERAFHLLAETADGQVVGSLRLVDDSARPFEVESFLDISKHIESFEHPAEITRLCILAKYRRITAGGLVHLSMLRAVFQLAKRLRVTHLVASTRPELMGFYQYLLFKTYSDETYHHPQIGSSLHTLMCLDIVSAYNLYKLKRPALYEQIKSFI